MIVGAVPLKAVPSERVPEIVPEPVTPKDSVAVAPLHIVWVPLIAPVGLGVMVKFVALVAVPLGVVTVTGPDVTPEAGKTASIVVAFTTVKDEAFTPLNCTAVAPVKLVPVIVTVGVVPLQALVGVKLVILGGTGGI